MIPHETLPRFGVSRRDMMKRVARFRKLKGSDGGLPDSKMPGCERILYNVIGFQPPKVERGGKQSPLGLKAARMAAIKISEGFNLGYCRAKPGKGPMLHNHDTNETFISMTGTWRAIWENPKGRLEHVDLKPLDCISFPPGAIRRFISMTGTWRAIWENPKGKLEHVDLKPLDCISFPPGAIRRFMNVTRGPKNQYSILMIVIGGDAPSSEFTTRSMREIEDAGALPGSRRRKKSSHHPAR